MVALTLAHGMGFMAVGADGGVGCVAQRIYLSAGVMFAELAEVRSEVQARL